MANPIRAPHPQIAFFRRVFRRAGLALRVLVLFAVIKAAFTAARYTM